jgi:hypothetical protein
MEGGRVSDWTQRGFALISDVPTTGMPFLHSFLLSQHDAESSFRGAQILPDHLRVNLRIVEAELHFDDEMSQPPAIEPAVDKLGVPSWSCPGCGKQWIKTQRNYCPKCRFGMGNDEGSPASHDRS